MIQYSEWAEAVRENGKGVTAAVVAIGGIVGLQYTETEGLALVEAVAEVVAGVGVVFVGVNVLVSRLKAAFKRDPEIDTGPTTPGPLSGLPDTEDK